MPRGKMISSALRALRNFVGADASPFERVGGAVAQFVETAMNVGVVVFVVMDEGINYRPRLLRCRCVVEIDQRTILDLLVESREIFAPCGPV
jgi:hypothetical protein